MDYPKFVLASDGVHAAVLLDGVCIGKGVERLDLSTEDKSGKMETTIRVMDLNVGRAAMGTVEDFDKVVEAMARAEAISKKLSTTLATDNSIQNQEGAT